MNIQELKKMWYDTARKRSQDIRAACDPPFTESSIHLCTSVAELKYRIGHGNWCVGQGFAIANPFNTDQHICFVNQIDGGDEWLTIKYDRAFESMTFGPSIKRKAGYSNRYTFEQYLSGLLNATLEECINLNYMKYAEA